VDERSAHGAPEIGRPAWQVEQDDVMALLDGERGFAGRAWAHPAHEDDVAGQDVDDVAGLAHARHDPAVGGRGVGLIRLVRQDADGEAAGTLRAGERRFHHAHGPPSDEYHPSASRDELAEAIGQRALGSGIGFAGAHDPGHDASHAGDDSAVRQCVAVPIPSGGSPHPSDAKPPRTVPQKGKEAVGMPTASSPNLVAGARSRRLRGLWNGAA